MPHKSNEEKNKRSPLFYSIISLIVLIGAMLVILAEYSDMFGEHLRETAEDKTVLQIQQPADKIRNNILLINEDKNNIACMIENGDYFSDKLMASTVAENGNAYMVIICDKDGKGINEDGKIVDISGTDYFKKMSQEVNCNEVIYVPDDKISGANAFVSVRGIENAQVTKYILVYYMAGNISNYLTNIQNGSDTYYMIVDTDGNVMMTAGKTRYKTGDNIWDYIEKINGQQSTYRMKKRLLSMTPDCIDYYENEKQTKLMVYCPLRINGWYLLASVDNDYVDQQTATLSRDMRGLVGAVIKLVIIFSCVAFAIVTVTLVNSNKNSTQLQEKADTDLLTSLNNKLATERKIKEYMSEHPSEQSVMMLLDIDNFKKINDTLGHAFGDEVLRSLGNHIGSVFRVTDIIGRTGGDEFMIFLKKVATDDVICKEAGKASDFFDNFEAGGYVKYSATASIGVAVYPREGASFEQLYKSADEALYLAKKRGKNQIAFHDPELGKKYDEMQQSKISERLNGTV
jgi:diguanylate cyclase (GGDEF)-like protein